LTVDPGFDFSPVWSPDGSRIVFEGQRSGTVYMRQKEVSGTAGDEPLLTSDVGPFRSAAPTSWSSDARFIAYNQGAGFASDVWILPLAGDRKPFPLAHTGFTETSGMFFPDRRWIAYTSNEGGRNDGPSGTAAGFW
jgi:hypothetical protein